ncbi:MAG: carboxypeptidase regulatory-like domain-containing protein [Proteobacteria bacterium]|nr:carboxypeptidase regulatory-like domain-containing protein [Pseudomonadota bacterium]
MKSPLRPLLFLPLFLLVAATLPSGPLRAEDWRGTVVEAVTGKPIAGATVTVDAQTTTTDAQGQYRLSGTAPPKVRAPGYARLQLTAGQDAQHITLTPLLPKALYLTVYGIGAPFLRDPALDVIERTGLNALVIDLKGDRGLIPYPSSLPLAAKSGAQKLRTIPDLKALVADLKGRGIYLIARIVVFKDDPLVSARPDWAIRNAGGGIWKDREGLAWIDPFRKDAWDYTLGVAEEAAAAGFDEIQFDYVRFPDAVGLVFSQPSTEASRVEAITGFLREAKRRLAPYNVFVAIDIFGYVCWNRDDTGIGQRLEDLATVVDYISPMLYPSSFQFGIPGYRNPVANPYEIVHLSLMEANKRTAGAPARYRPWLQAFTDYAFGGQAFGGEEIAKQVRAARDAGTVGWMLWNPRNVYSTNDIKPEISQR